MSYKESFYNYEIETENNRTLLYNSYSQALCWFDKNTYDSFHGKQYIESGDLPYCDIIRLGFCVPEGENELEKVLSERKAAFENNDTFEYVIAPTLKCNMHCVYCFENNSERCHSLTEENAETIAKYIANDIKEKNPKSVHIRWFGGEPTLEFEKIKQISANLLKSIDQKKITYYSSMITNGYFINRKMAKELKETCLVSSVQISLDGLKETYSKIRGVSPDVFDVVINNIVEAAEYLRITVRLNISHQNISEMRWLIVYLLTHKNLKGKIQIIPAYVRDYSFNDVNGLYSELLFEMEREDLISEAMDAGFEDSFVITTPQKRLFFCPVSRSHSITIGPDLKIYRCECLLGRKGHSIGDCINGITKPDVDSCLADLTVPQKCQECKLLPACGMGCTERIHIEGEPISCEAVKQRIITNAHLLLKTNKKERKEV